MFRSAARQVMCSWGFQRKELFWCFHASLFEPFHVPLFGYQPRARQKFAKVGKLPISSPSSSLALVASKQDLHEGSISRSY